VDAEVTIRPFAEHDTAQVRELFITLNRLLSPPHLRDAFEAYIETRVEGRNRSYSGLL
jgi:hypothetical protein